MENVLVWANLIVTVLGAIGVFVRVGRTLQVIEETRRELAEHKLLDEARFIRIEGRL